MYEEEEKDIWYKLGNIDVRWMFLACILLIFVPMIKPMGLPTLVSEPTKGYYNAITDLPPGSILAVSFGAGFGALDEREAQFIATFKTIFETDVNLLVWCQSSEGPMVLEYIIGEGTGIADPLKYGKVYGEDYVLLGYAPLGEPGETAIATDIRSMFSTDYRGTPLEELPMMEDIHNADDIDLLWADYGACTTIEWYIRQWVVPTRTRLIATTLGCCGPMAAPYYPDQLEGFLSGSGMGTEMEIISKNPGPGARTSDIKNLAILPFLLFLILGNISAFGKRYLKR
jgi:hypothetical protein